MEADTVLGDLQPWFEKSVIEIVGDIKSIVAALVGEAVGYSFRRILLIFNIWEVIMGKVRATCDLGSTYIPL